MSLVAAAAAAAAGGTMGGGGHNSRTTSPMPTVSSSAASSAAASPAAPQGGGSTSGAVGGTMDELLPLVMQLTNPDQREVVLLELSKKRESFPDLAPILWHSTGTVAALLQEIVSIYPLLTPPTLTAHASNRVCNALALLQCVASHADTRQPFLNAQIPLYLYPFLNTQSKSRPFEYLRLTSLGVIGALVKVDDTEVISFLLSTEIIPLCLRIMETGSELSKTVATFIVQKILLEETGLNYVCATAERFFAVSTVLANMVQLLCVHPSVRLLKHVVRCYLRLADHVRARDALKTCLPQQLRDHTFGPHLTHDPTVTKWLSQLLATVGGGSSAGSGTGAGGTNTATTTTGAQPTIGGHPQATATATAGTSTAASAASSGSLGLMDHNATTGTATTGGAIGTGGGAELSSAAGDAAAAAAAVAAFGDAGTSAAANAAAGGGGGGMQQ